MRPYYDVTRGSGDRDKLQAYELEGEIKRGELLPYDPVARERQEKAKAQKQAAATVQARIRLIESKGWPKPIEDAVKKKTVILGMTQEQVELSVGKPGRINRNVGSWGIHEQWVYGSSYLYFENGILKSWQDQR